MPCCRPIAWVSGLALAAPAILGQTPAQPVFRSGANLVEVDVVVSGPDGLPVKGLTRDDFEILEDGKPQTISTLIAIDVPAPAAATQAPPPPDRSGGALGSNEGPEGRLLVLAFDEWHVRPDSLLKARRIATMFINLLGPHDLAALVTLPPNRFAERDFTTDRALLLKGVNGVNTSSAMAARSFDTRFMFSRLRDVAKALAPVRQRRKTIVLISEGIGTAIDFENPDSMNGIVDLGDFIEYAHRSNVAVYTIDPRGLGEEAQTSTARDEQNSLHAIAAETGGRAIVNTEGYQEGIASILRDSGSYYVLGYDSASPSDGKTHRLAVRVKRARVQVRARRAFVATRPAPERPPSPGSAVAAVIEAPAQTYGLPMRVRLVTTPSNAKTGGTILVCAEIDGQAIPPPRAGEDAPVLELMAVAADRDARVKVSDRSALRVSATADRERVGRWIRVVERLDVAPGHYYIRFAAASPQSKVTGSVFHEIDVPKFGDDPVSMGSLVLVPSNEDATARIPKIAGLLPAPAIARSEIGADERVSSFVRIRASRPAQGVVDVVTTLKNPRGRIVFSHRQELSGADLAAAAGIAATVPLERLSPDEYTLRVEARRGVRPLASRELRFTVMP